jgi:hypothetical protein
VLADLSARRHAAREHLEQLVSAREVLASALATTREAFERAHVAFDEIVEGTDGMLDEAREVSEAARAAVAAEEPASADELDAFLRARRDGAPEAAEQATAPATATGEPEVVTSLFARIRADADAFIPAEVDPLAAFAPEAAPTAEAAGEAEEIVVEEIVVEEIVVEEIVVDEVEATADEGEAGGEAEVAERRDKALAGPQRGLGRALKRVLTEEQSELFDGLRHAEAGTLDDLLGPLDEQCVRYAAAARDELRDAVYAGTSVFEVPSEIAPHPDVDDLAAGAATEIVVPLRNKLADAWPEGGADDAFLEHVRETYRLWRTRVLPEVCEHYVALAFNRGLSSVAGGDADRWLVDV